MQNFNYHTHTYRCGHTQKDMTDEDFVNEFIKKGFKKIAFTDHCPQKQSIDKRKNMRMEYSQINEYLDSIKYLKDKYKDKIEIESGFEIEYLPGEEENLLELKTLLINNGWTLTTAICTMLFTIFHFPCGTTCLTIKKETRSTKWSLVSFFIPTLLGIVCCFVVNWVAMLL